MFQHFTQKSFGKRECSTHKSTFNNGLPCGQKICPVMHTLVSLLCSAQSLPWCNIFLKSPQSIELISTIKADKKLPVVDADWASAEHSVIMFSDCSIRVFDLKLIKSYSSIYNYEFDGQNIIFNNIIK